LSLSIVVLARSILAFSILFGWPTPIFFSSIKPSSKKESFNEPPCFLIKIIDSKSPPFNLNTASTARFAKWSLS